MISLLNILQMRRSASRISDDKIELGVFSTWIGECDRLGKNLTDEQVAQVGKKMMKNLKEMNRLGVHNAAYEHEIIKTCLEEHGYADEVYDVDKIIANLLENNKEKLPITEKNVGWFLGQVMKESKGTANPAVVKDKLMAC